jgi:hypothetical protein
MAIPDPARVARVERLIGRAAAHWQPVQGGYSPAARWVARAGDGPSVFVKAATNENTAAWLRMEHVVYEAVRAPFLANVLAWEDDGVAPVLLLEDLSAAAWPPPWTPERVQRALDMLDAVHASAAPEALPELASIEGMHDGWRQVAADPEPFLRLRLCGSAWLGRALGALVEAEEGATLAGDALLHQDVRSDNMCFLDDRAVLVDWNWACRGNALFDAGFWLPSLHVEGGPPPQELMPGRPGVAAVVSGYFAARAGLPPLSVSGNVRALQLRQLRAALPWAAHALGLEPPAAVV